MPTDPARRRPRSAGHGDPRQLPDDLGNDSQDDVYVVDTRKRRPAPGTSRQVDPRQGAQRQGTVRQRTTGTGPPPSEPRTRVRKGRVTLLVVGLLLLAWLAFLIWVPVSAWNNVARVDYAPGGQRPAAGAGHNYLLVGSDSREGLTAKQKRQLKTGSAEGKRTDTIMLVHVSESGGKPVLISIPRDSYVPVPDNGTQKINAAFAIGGAKLLTETVEDATGLRVDGYLEIGLGGFAGMVDALDGVEICVPRNMTDDKAGINLKKGCQVLNGRNALGYVRSRYEDPLGDIGRANRQRQFLGALMKQAATPSTVLIPWRYKNFVDASTSGITVGEGTSLLDAYRILQTMRAVSGEDGLSLTVPISDPAYPTSNAGVAVKWNTEQALDLFRALKADKPLTEPPAGTTPEKN